MKVFLCAVIIGCCCLSGSAQYFQFSQFNYTPQRLNPALTSSGNYMLCSFDFRNQSTAGGFSLTSNMLNLSYPFVNKKGQRWSAVGISLMDDRSGFAGIFNTQEAALSYAITQPLIRFHTLTLGLKVLYVTQTVDLDKLLTGSQYVQDRGLMESIDNGENSSRWRRSNSTLSLGLNWQNTDKKGTRLSYAGFSFFDFNKQDKFFEGRSDMLRSTVVITAGQRAWHGNKVTVFPEVLYTTNASNHVVNAGIVTSYDLKTFSKELPERVDFITKYVIGKWVTLGLQLHRRNFSFGASYDMPMGKENAFNLGAFEVGLEWKKLTRPLKSKKPKRKRGQTESESDTPTTPQPAIEQPEEGTIYPLPKNPAPVAVAETLSERLRDKQDSVIASGSVGQAGHEPFVIDKATLHFNFEFNSTGIGPDAAQYLDDLVIALKDNPELNVKLAGHTDDVGSDKFNLKLSFERARSIKEYLEKHGIESDRIVYTGKGERAPLNGNSTDGERSLNRRVELTILYENEN